MILPLVFEIFRRINNHSAFGNTMRACIQRVTRGAVRVDGQLISEISAGLVVLLGVQQQDTREDATYLAKKISELRIFPDDAGKMNRSLIDIAGEMLVVSQFTLLGDCRKGRRPSFVAAADPELGHQLYLDFVEDVRALGITVHTGQFRAHMQVELVNDGPVTMLLDSRKLF
jgi:D-tyrosyl-tRNA(Tyr) deacylase